MIRWEIAYGHAKEVLAGIEGLNSVCRDHGWVEWTAWAPFSGKENEIVVACDYPDLVTYVRERDARFADGEFMDAWRPCSQYAVQGSIWNEVQEPVPLLG